MSAGKELPNESEREFYETSRGETIHAFFEAGTYKVAQALDRNGLVPPPDIVILDPKMLTTEEDVARMLAEVKVEDPHFQKIDPKTDEGQLDLGILQEAKGEAVIDQKPGLRTKIRNFTSKVMDEIIDRIGGDYDPKRRKFITRTLPITGLALAMTACAPNIVGPSPTATDSGPGKSTATATAPATETAAATATQRPAPTEVPATATPEGPQIEYVDVNLDEYQISQDLKEPKKLPVDSIEHFGGENNAKFASWVYKAEEAGLFPKVPDTAEPFDTIQPTTQAYIDRMGKYGMVPMFSIDAKYKDGSKRPWVVASVWRINDMGISSFLVLIKYKNKDGSSGFWSNVYQPTPMWGEEKNGSYDWMLSVSYPTAAGGQIFINTPTVNGCQRWSREYIQLNGNKFCNWYDKEDSALTNPQEIIQNWKETGILRNYIRKNGVDTPYIPVVPFGGTNPGQPSDK